MATITISVNSPHVIPARYLEHFIKMIFFTINQGHKINFAFDGLHVLHWSRNKAAKLGIENNSDYVFYLDADVFIKEDTLLQLMSKNLDIVCGPYHFKNPPFFPQAYLEVEGGGMKIARINEKKLYEVHAVGGGCVLVKTDVFKKMKYPYYKAIEAGVDEIDEGLVYPKNLDMSEDIYFCKKARQAGFKIFYDNTLDGITHFGTGVDYNMHLKYIKEFEEQMKQQ